MKNEPNLITITDFQKTCFMYRFCRDYVKVIDEIYNSLTYRDLNRFPSELNKERCWRTRSDPYESVWSEISELFENNPGLEATTIFEWLQRRNPGEFQDGQLRTFQCKIKHWRATEGPSKEVMFPQKHYPGELSQSDFTHMGCSGVSINNVPFEHMIFHFVLTWSNWETGSICYSETFESLASWVR